MASSTLRRALLYVPASSERMLKKSLSLTVDNITYDLEDSVTPSAKADARAALRRHLQSQTGGKPASIGEFAARINAVSTPHALADLTALADLDAVDAIVVPKVNSASDLTFVTDVLRHVAPARHPTTTTATTTTTTSPLSLSSSSSFSQPLTPSPTPTTQALQPPSPSPPQPATTKPPITILALIESALAITNLRSICASTPYLGGLIFAAEDFALDLSLTRTPSLTEFLYARGAVATHARAAGLGSTIDLVCTSYRGEAGLAALRDECANGRGMGFNGKQCIHPSQVDIVQRMFAPAEAEVEWAVRVVIADEKAAAAGRGAWTLDGKMIDAPVAGKARTVVAKAERCGFNVQAIRQKWQHQEPEWSV
ncbi:hypothetical protein VTK26DRAFT_4643 [Humicola hyalothermophila]